MVRLYVLVKFKRVFIKDIDWEVWSDELLYCFLKIQDKR